MGNINKDYKLEDFYNKKLHFIGIFGISMRALATYSLSFASEIVGSDMTYNEVFNSLKDKGINVYVGHDEEVVRDADFVIYSSAVHDDDIELTTARTMGIPCIERCDYLAIISRSFAKCVAIAGTHGKSTVTALIDSILKEAGVKGYVHGGATLMDGDYLSNGNDVFVTEACEYRRSFLRLQPNIGVILNMDYDHPDEYSCLDEVEEAFREFAEHCDIVIAHDSVKMNGVIHYGESDCDYIIDNISSNAGSYTYDIVHGDEVVTIHSPLHGKHNVYNEVAAYIVCHMLEIDTEDIVRGIERFKGIKRRFERVGTTANGAIVITDYAHHPSEIARSIEVAHAISQGRVIAVFEPHTYSRTRSLIEGFLQCFYWADTLILLPTYSAREEESAGYNTLNLLTCLHTVAEYPLYFDSYRRAVDYLVRNSQKGDIILTMGAGSIYHLADMLVGK